MQSGRAVHRRVRMTVAITALVVVAAGCEDKQTVILQPGENRPPVIVQQGPATMLHGEPMTISLTSGYTNPLGEVPYIIVADPDGAADIVAVTETVQSLVVRRVVARPDTLYPGQQVYCPFNYARADTFDLSAYVKTPPKTIEGLTLLASAYDGYPYQPAGGGLYRGASFPGLLPALRFSSDAIGPGRVYANCGPRVYYVAPPLVPTGRDFLVTHIEIDVIGLTITAYDAGGHTVSATYPTFHVTLLDEAERALIDTLAAAHRHQ